MERGVWEGGAARLLLVHLAQLLLVVRLVVPLVQLEVDDEAAEVAGTLLHVDGRAPHVRLLDLRRRSGVAERAEVVRLLGEGIGREGREGVRGRRREVQFIYGGAISARTR